MRKQLRALTTKRLDGRSALAVAVRMFKADIRRDLGGDLSRAQEAILELAAQAWVIVSTLDDYIGRQTSLVTRRKQVIPVVAQRMQFAEGMAKQLERLGPERRAKPVESLSAYIARKEAIRTPQSPLRTSGTVGQPAGQADADQRVGDRARRPKPCRLADRRRLRQRVAQKLSLNWSPEQIAGWLTRRYPRDRQAQNSV